MHLNQAAREYFDTQAGERLKWQRQNRYYHESLQAFIGFLVPRGTSVLHIGADSSSLLNLLAPERGLGIHASARIIEQVNKQGMLPGLSFKHMELSEVSEIFEYVIISDLLGHVEDIETLLREASERISWRGRVVVTQHSAFWGPVLRLASRLGLRMPSRLENWISRADLENFAHLAGLEVVRSGTRMLFPKHIPFVSTFLNTYLANIFPFTRLGLYHYVVLRKQDARSPIANPSLSIVVPARNEAGMIERIVKELSTLGSFTELILIEGHSKDNTWEQIQRVAEKYGAEKKIRIAQQEGKGKGDAVRKGFDMATGDILTIYDADMTVPAKDMEKFYRALVEGRGDFINGSRLVYPLEKESMRFLNLLGNKFFSLAFSWLLNSRLKDTLCGTKMLWSEDYKQIQRGRAFFGDFDPFGDFDLLFGAAKLNCKIIDMPIHYKERTYGETNIRRWSHGWLLLKMTLFAMRKVKFV
ncbi:glycosyltransferase [Candidatus Kaiserbacteria bacterium]|nr:glycosyltransferase [Candidatus Kaiserbacteria bacterium]